MEEEEKRRNSVWAVTRFGWMLMMQVEKLWRGSRFRFGSSGSGVRCGGRPGCVTPLQICSSAAGQRLRYLAFGDLYP